jgi:sugar phosphate isomerase/epimerase
MEGKTGSQDCFQVWPQAISSDTLRPIIEVIAPMNSNPLWALAAGCVPDAAPWDIPRIAAAAGFESSGMWVDPMTTWQGDALVKTRAALDETGIQLVDVEALWLEVGDNMNDNQKTLIDAGLTLGARNVLVVSRHDNHEASLAQFRAICEYAGEGIRINLEFGEFTSVKSLSAAREFVTAVEHPSAGILIDLMHLNRAGEALPALDDSLFSYVQACDFAQSSAALAGLDYITAAVDGRCPLGEGEAREEDIRQVCQSDRDVSLEIRSKTLRDEFPDPFDRGVAIFQRCRRDSFT